MEVTPDLGRPFPSRADAACVRELFTLFVRLLRRAVRRLSADAEPPRCVFAPSLPGTASSARPCVAAETRRARPAVVVLAVADPLIDLRPAEAYAVTAVDAVAALRHKYVGKHPRLGPVVSASLLPPLVRARAP